MILIPVKNLESAKQRLAPALDPGKRLQLAQAMLEDVVCALVATPYRDLVTLVTGDSFARSLANRYSLGVLEDALNPGETGAIEMATKFAIERGAEFSLVLPGDIPLITPEEISRIFAAAPRRGSVLTPSASGRGTNAAYRSPADLFPLRFGNDSFIPHLEAARKTGHPVEVLKLAGFGLDVDEAEDLVLLCSQPGNTRAQQLARQWRAGERAVGSAIPRA